MFMFNPLGKISVYERGLLASPSNFKSMTQRYPMQS